MNSADVPLLTIGCGTRTVEELTALLKKHSVDYVVDVRSQPYSQYKPEFSRDFLESSLARAGLKYVFMGDLLGGLPADESCYTDGKADYLKIKEKPFFKKGLARLRAARTKGLRAALLCSEGKPEECHRSKLIGMVLSEEGVPVLHLDETGAVQTQKQIVNRLTNGGQLFLFGWEGMPKKIVAARKKHSARK